MTVSVFYLTWHDYPSLVQGESHGILLYLSINNVDSNPRVIQCGVPHGSILGPLLFLIFINDITKCSNQFKYILYADDSTLSTCVPGDNVMDFAELINTQWTKMSWQMAEIK